MSAVESCVVSHNENATTSTTPANTDCHTTYVMITPPENGTTLTIQTQGEIAEALDGSGVEENEITALVVGEEDLSFVGQTQLTASSSGSVGWSKAAVLKLIQLHKEHQHLFDDPHYKKKSVWEMVSLSMQKEGYTYSWIQVENKWKAITKKYRDTVDYNQKHGHILQRKCPFYNELSTVYEYTSPYQSHSPPSTQSSLKHILGSNSFQQRTVAVVTTQLPSSLKRPIEVNSLPTPSTSSSDSIKTVFVENQRAHDEQVSNKVLMKKKKYSPSSGDNVSEVGQVLHMLRVLNEDRRKQEKQRMDRLEKMHQEKMSLFREFLDVVKKSVNKDSSSSEGDAPVSDSKSSSNNT